MRFFAGIIPILMCIPVSVVGQHAVTPDRQIAEMEKLSFLVGEWEGNGWIKAGPGPEQTFVSSESVTSHLSGVALIVHGLHKTPTSNGEYAIIHDALAMITFDEEQEKFSVRTQLANGRGGNFTGEIGEEGQFIWGMTVPGGYQIRYTMYLDEEMRWYESGEMSQDGENWQQFFSMTLTKR